MPVDLSVPEVGSAWSSAWSSAKRRTKRNLEAKTGLKGLPRSRGVFRVRRGGTALMALNGAEIGCEEWSDDVPLTLGRSMFRRAVSGATRVATNVVNPVQAVRSVANITSDVTRAAATTALDVSRGNFATAFKSSGTLLTKSVTAPAVLVADTAGYGREARNLVKEYDFGAWMNRELLAIVRRIAREMIEAMGSAQDFVLGGIDERGMDWVYRQRNKVINTVAAGIGAKVTAATAAKIGPYSVAAGAASAALSTDISKGIIEEYREQMAKTRAEREAARLAREAAEKAAQVKLQAEVKKYAARMGQAAAAAGRAKEAAIKAGGASAASAAAAGAAAAGKARAEYEKRQAQAKAQAAGVSLGTPIIIAGAAMVALLVIKR